MNVPQKPYFLPKPPPAGGGVDFLGMRAVNLAMMDTLFAGLNNVASRVRPFSLLAWSICEYGKKAQRQLSLDGKEYRQFREKIETLYVWSHQRADAHHGLAGSRQKPPQGMATLSFNTFERKENNSFISAINYGPGLAGENGIGFARRVEGGLYAVTVPGRDLAEAFDASLTSLGEAHAFLRSTHYFTIDASEVDTFLPAWHIDAPSEAEQRTFLRQFYQPHMAGQGGPTGLRTDALQLLITTLSRQTQPLTLDALRLAMTLPFVDKCALDMPQGARSPRNRARIRWQVLVVRQAQRLAMESLFGWMERILWDTDVRGTGDIAQCIIEAIHRAQPSWPVNTLLPHRPNKFCWSCGRTEKR